MPKIDPAAIPVSTQCAYPKPFDEPCRGRTVLRIGQASGLSQFGVNVVELAPGAWASQRHWHEHEDEYAHVLEGELTLVEDAGETILRVGDSAAWPAGVRDGHHLQNRSTAPARFLVVGSRNDADCGEYPDIDLKFNPGRYSGKTPIFTRKNGQPY